MPLGIGPTELIIVLAIALVILGPKKLPDAGRSLGQGLREFKDSVAGDLATRMTTRPDEQLPRRPTHLREAPPRLPLGCNPTGGRSGRPSCR